MAYTRLNPPPRVPPPAPAPPIPMEMRRREQPAPAPRPVPGAPADPVIGARRPAPQRELPIRTVPAPSTAVRGPSPSRKPNPGQLGAQTPGLPRLYDRHRFLRFWYLPVAALLAVAVAVGVVWVADQLIGEDGHVAAPEATATPALSPTAQPTRPAETVTTTPAATATPATPVDGAERKFSAGDAAVVVGSAPQCLNVRSEAGLEHPAIDCIADGTPVTILAGPLEADGFLWWRIDAPNVIGWAAEDYLEPAEQAPSSPEATTASE